MKYKGFIVSIKDELLAFKRGVDSLVADFDKEEADMKKKLGEMREKYSESFANEYKEKWQPKRHDYKKEIEKLKGKCRNRLDTHLGQIKRELNEYFSTPPSPEFTALVSSIKTIGIRLSNEEFDSLRHEANGYWGLRLLSEIAGQRTKEGTKTEVKDGNIKTSQVETPDPASVRMPSIKNTYSVLKGLENSISIALGYMGKDGQLKRFFPDESSILEENNKKNHEHLKEKYGFAADYESRPSASSIIQPVIASQQIQRLTGNGEAYSAFLDAMGGVECTIKKQDRYEQLSDNEREIVDALVDPRYEYSKKEKVEKLVKTNDIAAELLMRDGRYRNIAIEALEVEKGEA